MGRGSEFILTHISLLCLASKKNCAKYSKSNFQLPCIQLLCGLPHMCSTFDPFHTQPTLSSAQRLLAREGLELRPATRELRSEQTRSPKVGCGKCGGYWQAIGLETVANLSHLQLILSDGKIGHIYMREIDISHDSGDIPDASFPCATCSPKHYRMSTSISSPPRIPWHMPKYMSTKDWGLSTNSTRTGTLRQDQLDLLRIIFLLACTLACFDSHLSLAFRAPIHCS